eukprot:m.337103 g.337103  ORF g.337103 m.337103 type:complete len:1151 (+) comp18047_c0_seq1:185-3637(+)
MDFLDPKNTCGQTLVRLLARGNAIVAELSRLAEFIPDPFKQDPRQSRYADIIIDFSYFKSSEYYDNKINSSPELADLDEEFRENHVEILARFYKAFESVLKYINDLNRFLEDLEEGVFIQQTMESVMQDEDGKQMMAESLYVYGVMLLVIDQRFEGAVRERILVSYYRYSTSEADQTNIDEVSKLLRSTDYSNRPGARRPPRYPEDYFSRKTAPEAFVNILISRLSSDDIYNQTREYPDPEHRSTALASQGSMLYVLLYFAPRILHNQQAKMREIVDKHFPDNWVISVYMGIIVDLVEAWEPYKAARTALNNTLDNRNVMTISQKHISKLPKMRSQIEDLLKEGVLHEEYVLDNVPKLLHTMREANVTIRWLMLHTYNTPAMDAHKKSKAVRDIVKGNFDPRKLFILLLNTSSYELLLREMFTKMLEGKQKKWDALRLEGSDRMSELSDVFGGATPLSRVEKNENLQAYFTKLGEQIAALDFTDSTSAGRKIVHLIQALEEVQEFHQLENSLQIRQFLKETCMSLHQMIRTINIREEVLITISIVADLSYSWQIIDVFTALMQDGIKRDPTIVIKLRATFLKLASALEVPLVRISQANSKDLESVSQHYSGELVGYVRKVLQIIPESMFEIVLRITEMQTKHIKEVPTRLDKDKLKDFAQLDQRAEVSRLTHAISVFTEGILMMKSTLVGVIKVDPKKLLEDGIRKELVRKVAGAFHRILVFNPKSKQSELYPRLSELSKTIKGFQQSFEYIQDYVNIYGLKIWQEEVSRIVNYNVEQECNSFLRTVVHDWMSVYQSKSIPIPRFQPVDNSVNFVGRLARELLRLSSPSTTCYVEKMSAWYDSRTQAEVLNSRICSQLEKGVGTLGLTGLDRFFSFMIVKELQNFQRLFHRSVNSNKAMMSLHSELLKALSPLSTTPESLRPYQVGIVKASKVWAAYAGIVMKVGQMQLIRRMIGQELNFSCKFDSKYLAGTLGVLNASLLTDIQSHYTDPTKPYPGDHIMAELGGYLDCAGISNPLAKIYVTTMKLPYFPVTVFFFVISQLQRLEYHKPSASLIAKKPGEPCDGAPLVAGIITLLKQFHSTHTHRFLAFMGQYIRSHIELTDETKDLPTEVVTALVFLDEFCQYGGSTRKAASVFVPEYLFDEYRLHLH